MTDHPIRLPLLVGLSWGVFCGVVNGVPVLTTLGQMAVPWVWVSVMVAVRSAVGGRQAAVHGGLALLSANAAYFGVELLARATADLALAGVLPLFALWTSVGLLIGPVAGVVGWWLTTEGRALPASALLAAGSIAEPLALWPHIASFDARSTYLGVAGVGLVFPLLWFGREWRRASTATATALLLSYPLAFEAILIALHQVSPPMRLI